MAQMFEKRLGCIGAGNETQTRGLFLGKEALYQLSYTRITGWDYSYFALVNQG